MEEQKIALLLLCGVLVFGIIGTVVSISPAGTGAVTTASSSYSKPITQIDLITKGSSTSIYGSMPIYRTGVKTGSYGTAYYNTPKYYNTQNPTQYMYARGNQIPYRYSGQSQYAVSNLEAREGYKLGKSTDPRYAYLNPALKQGITPSSTMKPNTYQTIQYSNTRPSIR